MEKRQMLLGTTNSSSDTLELGKKTSHDWKLQSAAWHWAIQP